MPAAPPTWAETEEIPSWEETQPVEEERPPRGTSPEDFAQPEIPRPSYSLDEPVPGGKPAVAMPGTTRLPDIAPEASDWNPSNPVDYEKSRISAPAIESFLERMPGAYQALSHLPLPKGAQEAVAGFKQGTAEQLSGMTSLESLATLPAFAVPYLGPALGGFLGGEAVGGGLRRIFDAKTSRERGQGASQVVGGGLMAVAPVLHGARPVKPPIITETIVAKVNAALPDALTKSKAAALEVSKDVPQQLEKPIEKGVPDAIREPQTAESLLRQERPEMGLQEVREPRAEAPAAPRESARAQGGAEPEVLVTPETAKAGVPGAELTADIARYNELQAELVKDPLAWISGPMMKESEAIKNKYGGYVPVEPTKAAAAEAHAAAPTPKPAETSNVARQNQEVTIEVEHVNGEKVSLKRKAAEMERMLTRRKTALEALRDCLTKA